MVSGSEWDVHFGCRHGVVGLRRAFRLTASASRLRDFFKRLTASNGDPLQVLVGRLVAGRVAVDGPHVDQAISAAVRGTGFDRLVARGEPRRNRDRRGRRGWCKDAPTLRGVRIRRAVFRVARHGGRRHGRCRTAARCEGCRGKNAAQTIKRQGFTTRGFPQRADALLLRESVRRPFRRCSRRRFAWCRRGRCRGSGRLADSARRRCFRNRERSSLDRRR